MTWLYSIVITLIICHLISNLSLPFIRSILRFHLFAVRAQSRSHRNHSFDVCPASILMSLESPNVSSYLLDFEVYHWYMYDLMDSNSHETHAGREREGVLRELVTITRQNERKWRCRKEGKAENDTLRRTEYNQRCDEHSRVDYNFLCSKNSNHENECNSK